MYALKLKILWCDCQCFSIGMFSEIDLDFHPPVSQCSISIDNINSHRECSNPVTKTTATTSFLVF